VRKLGLRFREHAPRITPRREKTLKSDAAEREYDSQIRHGIELLQEKRATTQDLLARGLVVWWGAVGDRGDVGGVEAKPVIASCRFRLARETVAMERAVQPIAATVPGKHPPGAIRPMGRGRKADDEKARSELAKGRDRSSPIFFIGKAFDLQRGDPLAVRDQARTFPTLGDIALDARQLLWRFGHG